MTKEDMIEKAAREYADVAKPYLLGEEMELVRNAFEAGAEWALANQWHDANDTPKRIDFTTGAAEHLLVRLANGKITIGYWLKGWGYKSLECRKDSTYNFVNADVTHWCEMPPFENKQPQK